MLNEDDVLLRTGGRPVSRIVYDEAAIAAKVEELGRAITKYYPDGDLLVLGLLKGSFIFLSDLVRQIHRPDMTRKIRVGSALTNRSTPRITA